jgi:hypothetical protein
MMDSITNEQEVEISAICAIGNPSVDKLIPQASADCGHDQENDGKHSELMTVFAGRCIAKKAASANH